MTQVRVEKIHTLTGHRDCVYTLCASPDPGRFFSGAGDGMATLWDLNHPSEGELIAKLPNAIYALHYLPNSDQLVVGHNFDGIHVLDWRSKKESYSLQLSQGALFDISSHGSNIYIVTGLGEVIVVNEPSRSLQARIAASKASA